MSNSPVPVPCRGCLPDCPNRNRCDGKPWRMDEPETKNASEKKVVRH